MLLQFNSLAYCCGELDLVRSRKYTSHTVDIVVLPSPLHDLKPNFKPFSQASTPFSLRGLTASSYSTKSSNESLEAHQHGSASDENKEAETVKSTKDINVHEYWGIAPKTFKKEDGSVWPWRSFRPHDSYNANVEIDLHKHFKPKGFEDAFARYLIKAIRIPTDIFFQKRYGCRAMMLETVAAVPGMVAGMLLHLKSLRLFQHSGGWIRALLEEAENERMHLMTFMEVSKPNVLERALVITVQAIFFNVYLMVYILNPRLAHRIVGYLEEEAIHSYTEFIKEIDSGRIANVPAPRIAIDYWRLPEDATLRDVVVSVRADEAHHRDVNHFAANVLRESRQLRSKPAPIDYH